MEITDPQNVYNVLKAMTQNLQAIIQAINLSKPFPAGFVDGYEAALATLTLALGYEPPPTEVQGNE